MQISFLPGSILTTQYPKLQAFYQTKLSLIADNTKGLRVFKKEKKKEKKRVHLRERKSKKQRKNKETRKNRKTTEKVFCFLF